MVLPRRAVTDAREEAARRLCKIVAAASILTRISSLVVVGQRNLSLDAVVRCGDD